MTQGRAAAHAMRGFTLIELMVAVAIVGVLAALAYPGYTEYVRRGKIADGLGELAASRVKMEQYYQDFRRYGEGTTCGRPMPSRTDLAFTITCALTEGNNQRFLMTATGKAAAGMDGYVYSVNEGGAMRTESFAGTVVDKPCWLKRRGDAC